MNEPVEQQPAIYLRRQIEALPFLEGSVPPKQAAVTNIAGLPGAGKSTLGAALAEVLSSPFADPLTSRGERVSEEDLFAHPENLLPN